LAASVATPADERDTSHAPPADRRFWLVLGLISLGALAWRIAYVLMNVGRLQLNGDASYYHWQANDIADGKWFIDPVQLRILGRVTESAFHPPAYIVYLASVSKFIGTSETTHRIASCLLGAGAVFVLGCLARRVFASDMAGWLAAILAAAYAHLWINDEMLMAESMYVLTISLAILCAYRFWDAPSTMNAALMGLSTALAAASRAEAFALFPFLVIPFALLRRDNWGERLRVALVACLAGGLLLAPWIAFNLTRFEHPVLISNGAGSVLMVANCERDNADGSRVSTYDGTYAGYWSIQCALDLDERIDAYFPRDRAESLKRQLGQIPGTELAVFGDESTHEVAWRAVGLKEMRRHAGEMPKVVVLRVLRMWDFYRPLQNIEPLNSYIEGRGLWQSRLATAQYYPLLALSVFGLVILRRRRVPILPFLAVAASVTLAAAMTFGITRYRASVDAMLPVLAAGALVTIGRTIKTRLEERRAPAPTS
jgi:4-amino-4-deoxy-L-arabinose transferase-like glycosyltransferase